MISFKGIYLGQTYVQEADAFGKWKPKETSLVQITPHDKNDLKLLADIALEWKPKQFTTCIYVDAVKTTAIGGNTPEEMRFFALTEQQDKFDKLDKNLILGICESQNYSPKLEEISFLQVKPELQNGADKQKYRHVGAALLNSLVNLFHTKNIILDAIDGTIPFYVKNGFQKLCKEADFWNGASKMLIKNIK